MPFLGLPLRSSCPFCTRIQRCNTTDSKTYFSRGFNFVISWKTLPHQNIQRAAKK